MPDRNEEYYLEDIVFQVEDQLFKVPRRLFVKLSPVFRNMFKLRVTDSADAEGLRDERPLVLAGVEKKDFVPLLRFLYPMQLPVDSNFLFLFTLEEWRSVLKLASLYEMAEVKTLVIRKMEPFLINLPSLQIHLAKIYTIQQWLAPALYRLAQRVKPLDEEDVKLVGLSDSLKICALREKSRRCEKCGSCGTEVHSGGFGLKEIGHAFDIRGSNLPNSVLGCEQNCTCSSKAFQSTPAFDFKSFISKPSAATESSRSSLAPDLAPKSSQRSPFSSAAAKPSPFASLNAATESLRLSPAPDSAPKLSQPSPSGADAKPSQSAASVLDPAPKSSQPSPSSSVAAKPSQSVASPSTAPQSIQSSSPSNTVSSGAAPKSVFSFLTASPSTTFAPDSSPGVATKPVFSFSSTSSQPAFSFSLTPSPSTAPNLSVTLTSPPSTPNPSVTPTSTPSTAPDSSAKPTSSPRTAPNPSVKPSP